jgi:hypothetical protein
MGGAYVATRVCSRVGFPGEGGYGSAAPRAWKAVGRGRTPRPTPSDEFDLDFDLDRGVEREDGDADGAAGVDALVAQDLAEEFARAVDDGGLAGEVGGGGDEADHLDDAGDEIKVTGDRADRGQRVERAASSLACSGVISAPTLPVAASLPSTMGSCPEV